MAAYSRAASTQRGALLDQPFEHAEPILAFVPICAGQAHLQATSTSINWPDLTSSYWIVPPAPHLTVDVCLTLI